MASQQQDVTGLSRDAAHANQTLSPIFDQEKEQNRLATAQKTGEIGRQVSDVLVTQGKLNAQAAQSDPAARAAARAKLVAGGNGSPSEEQINAQVSRTATADYDTGGKYQKVAQAVTAAMQGLAGGDLAQAASGDGGLRYGRKVPEGGAGGEWRSEPVCGGNHSQPDDGQRDGQGECGSQCDGARGMGSDSGGIGK